MNYNASKMVYAAAVCFIAVVIGAAKHALAVIVIGVAALAMAGVFELAARRRN